MIIFDTETTGLLMPDSAKLEQQPHIIELAMVKVDAKYKIIAELSTLIDPGVPIDEVLHAKITKLKNSDLKGKPIFPEALEQVMDFCLGERKIVAHNAPFDMGVLRVELQRLGKEFSFPYPPEQICTAALSVDIAGRRMRLIELYEHLMGKKLKQTHRALDDVKALLECVRKMKL